MSWTGRTVVIFLGILLHASALLPGVQAQTPVTQIVIVSSTLPNSDQETAIIVFDQSTNSDGMGPPTNGFQPPLTAIINRGTNVSFAPIQTNGNIQIYSFPVTPLPDSLAETYTLFGSVGSTNVQVDIPPFFSVLPQNQSVFVGSNVTFTAQVTHTTGLQWVKDGTNLFQDGHFSGVTNSVLSIANVNLADAGTYSIVAAHPTNPVTNSATLAVFKPILLTVAQTAPGLVQLFAANADQSPFEPKRLSNVVFYTTADLGLSVSNWTLSTNLVQLTNGILEVDIPVSMSSNQFWISVEHP
jgi:hypothetical protein